MSNLKALFPLFQNHPELVYLDNAASTQKPRSVIDRLLRFYTEENSNVRRGVYHLSEQATIHFDEARQNIANYLNASAPEEIIFVRGATEAFNFVAQSWGGTFLKAGDEILLTAMEHHSNIVPWQEVAQKTGAKVQVVGLLPDGELDREDFACKLSEKTKILALTQASNVLGTINPVKELVKEAKRFGAKVLIDGAQWVPHGPLDVQDIGCDFYGFSAHKAFGPMGIGILYGKREILEQMPPYQTGGGMVIKVQPDHSTFRPLPEKFEAGTQNIAGAVTLSSTIDFLRTIDWQTHHQETAQIRAFLEEEFQKIAGLKYIGNAKNKVGVFSISLNDVHAHDLATFLGTKEIATRAGNHCAQLLLPYFGITQSLRASFAVYNTLEDAQKFISALRDGIQFLRGFIS